MSTAALASLALPLEELLELLESTLALFEKLGLTGLLLAGGEGNC